MKTKDSSSQIESETTEINLQVKHMQVSYRIFEIKTCSVTESKTKVTESLPIFCMSILTISKEAWQL